MNKKRALFVSVVACFTLVHPLSRLMSFADEVICLVMAHAGCVNPPRILLSELAMVFFNHFGARTVQLVLLVLPFAASLNRGCKWPGVQTLTAERRRLV